MWTGQRRLSIFTACLLTQALAAGAQTDPILTDCATPEPVVVPEALPEIRIDGRTLSTTDDDAYRPVAVAVEGGYMVAGATVSDAGRDILLARLDGETGEVLGGTVVGGSGDDVAQALAVGAKGQIVLAGSSDSHDLAPGQRAASGRDGFALTLDAESLKVVEAAFVATEGEDSIRAVVRTESGEMLLAGTSDGEVIPTASGQSLTTVFPRGAREQQTYFVARAEGASAAITGVFDAAPVETLDAWIDCKGEPVVGVLPLAAAAGCGGWPDLEYTMGAYNENYHIDHDWGNPPPGAGSPPGGFGYHALRWKSYWANSLTVGNPWTVDWTLAPSGTPIPKGGTVCGQASELNTLEGNVFANNGTPDNPGGTWLCGQHSEVQELGLIAAFLSQRWGTPTYTNFVDRLPSPEQQHTVGIEKTTFEVVCPGGPSTYNGETLDDLCDFSVNTVNQLQCSVSPAGVSRGAFYLVAKEFETSSWQPLVWFIRPVQHTTDWTWWWEDWHIAGDYIFDPPEDDMEGVEVVQTAARYMLPRMAQETSLQVDSYEGGKLVRSEATWSYVRATDL